MGKSYRAGQIICEGGKNFRIQKKRKRRLEVEIIKEEVEFYYGFG